ncbi:ATP-binding protein [Marinobacter sp. Arc7-DN-1]|uniref:ATP-binding protein n=1 Tax=Marinobacter sp. Arc7-DN-1 TaxID=2304594 RepID=UPI0013C30CE8|nr:ATP-binding protein [Marinobacter sp. Arc7-DN-1]
MNPPKTYKRLQDNISTFRNWWGRRSIRKTLFSYLFPMGLAFMLVVWISHQLLIGYLHEELHRSRLEAQLSQFTELLAGSGQLTDNKIKQIVNSGDQGSYIFSVNSGESIVVSEKTFLDVVKNILSGDERGIIHYNDKDHTLLGIASEIDIGGKKIQILVLEKENYKPAISDDVHLVIGVVALALFFSIIFFIYLSVNTALKPLGDLSVQLSELKNGRRTRLAEDSPVEFREVVVDFNHLLEVLDRRLKRSRRSMSDLSHSIKTPLTVAIAITGDQETPIEHDDREFLHAKLSELRKIIDAQMRRAEMSGQYSGKPIKVVEKVEAIIDVVRRIYPRKSYLLKKDLPDDFFWPIDEHDFNEVVGNILDNAAKWSDGRIDITLAQEKNMFKIMIEDDGPGVAQDNLDQLTKRKRRLDEQTPGYGLGLSIVDEIVDNYSGKLIFSKSKMAGLRVEVIFSASKLNPAFS